MASRDFHRLWFALIALVLAVEVVALRRDGLGDTLSEWTWSKIRGLPLRMALGALLMWLVWHFLFSGPHRGFTKWDGVAVALGALAGFAAVRVGWR